VFEVTKAKCMLSHRVLGNLRGIWNLARQGRACLKSYKQKARDTWSAHAAHLGHLKFGMTWRFLCEIMKDGGV